MKQEINPKDTNRAIAFELWTKSPMPMVTLTKTFDVTRLRKVSRRRGMKFNMLLCWCIGKAASGIEEFYMLPQNGKLYKYDRMAINVIADNVKGGLSFCDVAVTDDLEAFNANYLHLTNPITQWNFLTETDAMLCKHINLDKPINTLSAYLAVTPRVGIWSLNATAGFEKQDLYLDVEGPQGVYRVYYDKPQYTLNAYNTFTLKHGWRFDVNLMYRSSGCSYNFYNDTYNLRLGLVAQKSLLKDNSLTLRAAVLDCFQRNRMNEFSDCGYNQIQQNNRFSTHKLMLSLIYRLNATRSKYKGTGAGKDAQARMGS